MSNFEKTKTRLMQILCDVPCVGPDFREGGCPGRVSGRCRFIESLHRCQIEKLALALIAAGVTFPEDADDEV